MSTVRVQKAHSLDPAEARVRLGSFEQDLAQRGARLVWEGDTAEIQGTGVSGSVRVTASEVSVEVKLGLLARAAGVKADRLQASIEKRLNAAFDAG